MTARILIVEDDHHVLQALVDELATSFAVEAVASPVEAMDRLAAERFDVVIADLTMPGHDGIEVLECARARQGDAVRILLTGYLDERAHKALLLPDGPLKVGKPWRDELEIAVRRGLEHRDLARRLHASVEDALRLGTLDTELAVATTQQGLVEVVVRRALAVDGVDACCVVSSADGRERVVAGAQVSQLGPGWLLDLPLDASGVLSVRARGTGESARQVVSYVAHRAQRRFGVLEPREIQLRAPGGASERQNQLIRQATLGAMTGTLLHDLAATMQSLSGALAEICDLAEQDPRIASAASDALAAGTSAIDLFVMMRQFIRAGEVPTRPTPIKHLIDSALRLTQVYVRDRARLVVHPVPGVDVLAADALMIQVFANLLRNAASASPRTGTIDLEVTAGSDELVVTITDDGPGVDERLVDHLFEPFAANLPDGTGLGLAIAAYVVQCHGGRISYRKHPDRGACFQVVLRRSVAQLAQPAA